jgi:hypothetical protein
MAFFQHVWMSDDYWLGLSLALVVLKLLYNKYGHGLNSIPGPFAAGLSNLWRFYLGCFGTPHERHIQLHRRNSSSLVRLGPRAVSVADPDLIPLIYGIHSGFNKTKYYDLSQLPHEGSFSSGLFGATNDNYHALCKRPIANAYSMSTIVEFEPLVDATTSLLMSRLDHFTTLGTTFDLGLWLQYWASDALYVYMCIPTNN